MVAVRATICNKKGLHARAAAKLVNLASGFKSNITILRLPRPGETNKNESAGATSILSLLMLAAERGVEVEVRGDGADAEKAVAEIVALIERRFEEEE